MSAPPPDGDRPHDQPTEAATLPPGEQGGTVAWGGAATPPNATLPLAAPLVPPLEAVPGYVVLEELGRGGMGVVYKARQKGLDRVVALKMVLAGGHAGPAELARFVAEGHAVARLQHPNIVQVFEVGQHAGLPFCSLEYVAGGNLARRLGGRPQQPHAAARLLLALAEAVQHAHESGVVHRDLKPANILLAGAADAPLDACVPKIADFGLAKEATGGGLTATGAILGTPSYMAPEQAHGRKAVTAAADVYALGAILYECLTGRAPFVGVTPLDILPQVLVDDPVAPRRVNPTVPRDLETVCLRCLRKEPEKRYGSARELADDLGRFLDDRPVTARPAGRFERAWRWCRRNPAPAALAAAIATLLVLLAAGASVSAVWLRQERDVARREQEHAADAEGRLREQLDATRRVEQEKTDKLWQSLVDRARAGRFSQRAGQRFDSLAALAEAARIRFDPRLRDEAVACLALSDVRALPAWRPPAEAVGHAFDIDRRLAVWWDGAGGLRVVRLDDGAEAARLSAPGRVTDALLGPGGAVVAARCQGPGGAARGLVWRPDADAAPLEIAGVKRWALSDDGRRLVVGLGGGRGAVHELPSGRRRGELHGLPDDAPWALSPEGTRLAAALADRIRVFDLDADRWSDVVTPQRVNWLAWHPDGKRLVSTYVNVRSVQFWDAGRGVQLRSLDTVVGGSMRGAVGRGGDVLALTEGWASGLRLWHPRTGRLLLSMPGPLQPLDRAAADGRLWGVEGGRVWEAVPGREYRTLRLEDAARAPSGYYSVAIDRDGRLLAASTSVGVGLWDMGTGEEVAFVTLPGAAGVAFDPATGSLLTRAKEGLLRWPVRPAGGGLTVGPPEQLPGVGGEGALDVSGDGRVLVAPRIAAGGGALMVREGVPVALAAGQPDVRSAAVSPDGKWVATGSHDVSGLRVWEAATGRQVLSLDSGRLTHVAFSPDNRWLAVGGRELRLYEAGTWKAGPALGGAFYYGFCWSPDSRLLAAEQGDGVIRLVETESGKVLVRLAAPDQDRVSTQAARVMTFSRDGSRLVFSGMDTQSLHVWDLRALREQLRPLGLDWTGPAYGPAAPPGPRLAVTLDTGGLRPPAPTVVVLPGPRRAATAQEIAGWVARVGGPDSAEAERSLAEAGAPALPALAAAARTADGPRRERLEAVRERVEAAVAVAPRQARLRLEGATPAEAVRALAAQIGLPLTYRPPGPGVAEPGPVTLALDDVPDWEAVDRLAAAAGLVVTADANGRTLLLTPGRPTAAPVAYAGPFRLQALSWAYTRAQPLAVEAGPRDTLSLTLSLMGDPRRPVNHAGPVRVVEAEDDAGRVLLPAADARPAPPGVVTLAPQAVVVTLNGPEPRPARLRRLSGVVPVEVTTRRHTLATVASLGQAAGQTFGTEGVQVRVQRVNRDGRALLVEVVVTGPVGWSYDQASQQFAVYESTGRGWRASAATLTPRPRRDVRPGDLAWLGAPLAGLPAAAPWAALAAAPGPQQWEGTLQFLLPERTTTLTRLAFYSFQRVRVDLPFELRDLPLP
jgi:WD40 repeat protein